MADINASESKTLKSVQLETLPEEVLQTIFQYLDALSVHSTSLVCKRFAKIADGNLIWKELCLHDFRYWDTSHDIEARKADLEFRDWKGLYAVRHRAHIATSHSLRAIINASTGRIARVQRVCDHGYGIKDSLLQLYEESPSSLCPLAQRYWTYTLLSCLNRARALEVLTRVRYRSDVENPTELALAALDMFTIGSSSFGDIEDTFRRLNEYVSAVRATYPDLDLQTPRTKAVTIASFLRSMGWVGIAEGAAYYSLENQFLGYSLRSTHRNSLPLISCVIYSYVCRAFNLRAQPCSYPNHVHAVVQPGNPDIDLDGNPLPSDHPPSPLDPAEVNASTHPPSELTHLYLDPFNTHQPIPLSVLRSQLNITAAAAPATARLSYLLPAEPRSLLMRTGNNILRSINTLFPPPQASNSIDNNNPQINVNDAAYAALYLLILFPATPRSLASNLQELRQHFAAHYTEDISNYVTYISPLLTTGLGNFGGHLDSLLKAIRDEDADEKKPKTRDSVLGGEEVMYKVGTIFRHRRQGYIAVVYGWDAKCEMEERWIQGNNVDRLPGGRRQPFYNSYVNDQTSRYVAQENIIPLSLEEIEQLGGAESVFSVEIGKWFRSVDPTTGWLVSNVRDEYPED